MSPTKRMLSIRTLIVTLCFFALGAATLGAGCLVGRNCIYLPLVLHTPAADPNSPSPPTQAPPTPVPPTPMPIKGLAIIGDSTQDEYRADDSRGTEYSSTTFNWVEILERSRNINVGPLGERDEPRRSGYEYNWARSGATTQTMLEAGQAAGVAEQIRAGKVSHVLIQIGGNDFTQDNFGQDLFTGQLTNAQIHARLDTMAANVDTAVRIVKQAGAAQVMLAATQDYATPNVVPEVQIALADAVERQRVIDAYAYLNQQLRQIAAREQVAFFDYNAAFQAELARRVDSTNHLIVGQALIDLNTRGDEPHHGLLDDAYVHPGTVVSAVNANLYIAQMNAVFGTSIAPLSDAEILRMAGIEPSRN
jgi:lysophospholipase L1-like esterase